ncbi:MAG: hypothetical protein KGD72_09835 [Candidatus Lokiarchaeota archaeon]|nr:hypothetical protein [Candidatus Lokiarchaeota archaeon]
MHDINWDSYRHPKFLQSLTLTLNELKILNLFLKRPNLGSNANLEHLQNTTLVSPRRSLNPTKIITQEKIGIKI